MLEQQPTKNPIKIRHKVRGVSYLIWKDFTGSVRWAVEDWPDDGVGMQRYGRAKTVPEARKQIEKSHRLWSEVT